MKISKRFGIIFLCFFASLFLIYAVLGFWVFPAYIKSKAENVALEKLHRHLTIQKLEFNPFTFSMNVDGLKLSEPNGKENFVTFDQLKVDVSPTSLLRMTPVVTEFKLVRPFLRVVRISEEKRNFDDIFAFFNTYGESKSATDKENEIEEKRPQNAAERRAAISKRKFGIYNFQVIDAHIELENKEKGRKTVISEFNVGLPYLYRGPIRGISRFVEPRFDALINGKKLEIVQEEPVQNSRDRILKLNMDNIDLTRIFNYLPFNPAYRLKKGWLDLHLSCHIQRPKNAPVGIDIGGQVTVRSVYMTQSDKPLVDLERMDWHLGKISLENRAYHLEKIEVVRPKIYAISDRDGALNFLNLFAGNDKKSIPVGDRKAHLNQQETSNTTEALDQEKTTVSLNEFLIKKAQLHYDDQSTVQPMVLAVNNLDVSVKNTVWDVSKQKDSQLRFENIKISNDSSQLKGLQKTDSDSFPMSLLANKLNVNLSNTEIDLNSKKISIDHAESLSGNFEIVMENHSPRVPVVKKNERSQTPFSIHIGKISVRNWFAKLINSNRYDPFEVPFSATLSKFGVTIDEADINLQNQTVSAGTVTSKNGEINMELLPFQKPTHFGKRAATRAALLKEIIEAEKTQSVEGFTIDIHKMVLSDWLAKLKNKNTSDRAGLPISGEADNINFVLNKIRIDTKNRLFSMSEMTSHQVKIKGQLEKHEKFVPKQLKEGIKPVVMPSGNAYTAYIDRVAITDWSVKGRNINLKKTIGSSFTHVTVTGQDISSVPGKTNKFSVQATVNKTGTVKLDGKASLSPLNLEMALNLKDVSVIGVQPYIDDYVNLTIDRANLSATGNVNLKESASGALEGGFKGDVTLGQLNTIDQIHKDPFIRWNTLDLKNIDARINPLSINIEKAEFDNFYTRLILNSDGRLNLRNILRSEAGGQVSLTETEEELAELAKTGEETKIHTETKTEKEESHKTDAVLPMIVVEKIELKKGRVRFTDNFIKPHYTANISDMEGTITGFTSDPDAVSRLDIRGFVNRAPLVAAGTISPLKEYLALDVKAQVRGMELAQFSSYTTKYIGYGIDKGKLSFDVEYKLKDGVLVAQNRLILDQLTFGEKAPGEAVTSLPVELAVSLLKDGNGVIDINLPIGGSLEDPNFSIGEILAKVFLSSLKKIILSPFAFLSLEFGGNAELAWIDFEPGSFQIPQKEISKLEILAKALTERPALKLDVTGRYDPSVDRIGLVKSAIQRKMKMLKLKSLQEKGEKVTFGEIQIEDNEYPSLLERVYFAEDFEKPRNLIGLQKKVSVAEMEKIMEDNYVVKDEELMALAYRRSEYVKNWFIKTGRIADSRIFILASKQGESGENGETAARVDFSMK